MARVKIFDLVVDLTSIRRFQEFVERGNTPGGNNPINMGLKNAAEMYVESLKQRYNRLAETGGTAQWPDIEEETKDKKLRRGFDPDSILINTGQLRDAISYEAQARKGYVVGYVGEEAKQPHWEYKAAVSSLAELLQYEGTKNGKTWKIIVLPTGKTKSAMIKRIHEGVRAAVRKANAERRGG